MSYASQGEKIFEYQSPFRGDCSVVQCSPPKFKRSDHRLKRFHSTFDRRAWHLCEALRYRSFYELVSGSQVCLNVDQCHRFVPLEDLIDILMKEKEDRIKDLEDRLRKCCGDQSVSGHLPRSNEAEWPLQNEVLALNQELNDSREMLRKAMHKLQNIDEIINENKKLHCRLRCSEERIKYLEEKKKHLERELADLRSKSQIQIDLNKAQEMLAQLREEPNSSKEEPRNVSAQRDDLQEKVIKLEKELEDFKKKENEIEVLKSQSQSSSFNIEEISRENECYRKKLASMKCLEKQIQELKKQGRVLADKYKRDSQKAADQMKRMCQATKELQTLREERDSLKKRVDELSSLECQYNSLKRKLQRVDAVIAENETLNCKLVALDRLEKENEYLRCRLEQIREMEVDAAGYKERILQLQSAVADQEEEMKDLLCQIERLTRGQINEEVERLRCELVEKSSKLKLCEEQLAEIPMLEAEIDELRTKLQCCCREFSEKKTNENQHQKIEVRFPSKYTGISAKYKSEHPKSSQILGTRREEKIGFENFQSSAKEENRNSASSPCLSSEREKQAMSCEEVQSLLQSSKEIISCVLEDMIEHQKEMEELETCNKAMKEEMENLKSNVGKSSLSELQNELQNYKKLLETKEAEIRDLKCKTSTCDDELDTDTLKKLNQEMKAELEAACKGLKEISNLEKMLELEHEARCRAEGLLKQKGGIFTQGVLEEDPDFDCCKALQKELDDLKLQVTELNKLTSELKKENNLLRELQQPGPDFAKELDEKCALENLLSLLQAELDAFKGQKLSDECEALRNELKRVMEQNCQLKALVDCYRQRLDLEKKSQELGREKQEQEGVKSPVKTKTVVTPSPLATRTPPSGTEKSDNEKVIIKESELPTSKEDKTPKPKSQDTQPLEQLGPGKDKTPDRASQKENDLGKKEDEKLMDGPPDTTPRETEKVEPMKTKSPNKSSLSKSKTSYDTEKAKQEGLEVNKEVEIELLETSQTSKSTEKPIEQPIDSAKVTPVSESEKTKEVEKFDSSPPVTSKTDDDKPTPGQQTEAQKEVKDVEPPQNEVKDVEPPRKEVKDVQPPQKEVKVVEPPRKEVKDVEPPQKEVKDVEPPRKEVKDVQPPQKEVKDVKPAQKEMKDVEPPQKEVKDVEPPRKEVKDVQPAQKEVKPMEPAQKLVEPEQKSKVPPTEKSAVAQSMVEKPPAEKPKASTPPEQNIQSLATKSPTEDRQLQAEIDRLRNLLAEKETSLNEQKRECERKLGEREAEFKNLQESFKNVEKERNDLQEALRVAEAKAKLEPSVPVRKDDVQKEAVDVTKTKQPEVPVAKVPPDAEDYQQRLRQIEKENEEKLRKLMEQHEKELINRDKVYNDNLNAMKSGYETDIRKLTERHKMSIMRLQGLHEDEIQELNTNYETQMESMQTQSEEAMNDVAKGSAAKMRKLAQEHEKEIKSVEAKFHVALEEKETKFLEELTGLKKSLAESTQEVNVLKKKAKDAVDEGKSALMAKHSREIQKMKKSSSKRLSLMKTKYEGIVSKEKQKSEAQIDVLNKKLKEQETEGGGGVCDCKFEKKKARKARDPTCPLDFNDVLEKILEEGLDCLTFNEIALVHRKICCALEGIVMNSNIAPTLEPPVGDSCPHTPLLEADKQQLLNRIFILEKEIANKQRQTQDAIINMEISVKKERCRLQELRNILQNEQRKNSELTLLLTSQTKLQSDLKKERDKMCNQATLQQTLCMEKSKQLNQEIKDKQYLEEEVEKLRMKVKQLCKALDLRKESFDSIRKQECERLQILRGKLEQAANNEHQLALRLDNEIKCRMQLQEQIQILKQSFKQMVNLPSLDQDVRILPNPLEAKSAKDKQNLDQIKEKKYKTRSKFVKKNKK